MRGLRSIVRPSAHSGGKSWEKVGTGDSEVSGLPAASQINDISYLVTVPNLTGYV